MPASESRLRYQHPLSELGSPRVPYHRRRPRVLVQGRASDAKAAVQAATARAAALTSERESQDWAREIHLLFERELRELKTAEIAVALGWPHSTTKARLNALTASIEMVNQGRGTKSVRWRPLKWT